jgi:plastocyanin
MPSFGSVATAVTVVAGLAGGVAVVGSSASAAPETPAAPRAASAHAGHHDAAASALVTVAARTATVKVVDHEFVPSKLSVKAGTTVKWVWGGRSRHNARAAKGPVTFDSGLKLTGTYSRKLTKKGSYLVVCDPHLPHMKMTIKVW